MSSDKKPGFWQRLFGGRPEEPAQEGAASSKASPERAGSKPAQKEPPERKKPPKKAEGAGEAKKAAKAEGAAAGRTSRSNA